MRCKICLRVKIEAVKDKSQMKGIKERPKLTVVKIK